MVTLNKIGELYASLDYVLAMTDVTGFGLLGHLIEMCEASNTSANIFFNKIPLLDKGALDYYLSENCIPGGTFRNWDSYGSKVGAISDYQKQICCDPQTSGGILVAVESRREADFLKFSDSNNFQLECIGEMIVQKEKLIYVEGAIF